MKMDSYRRFVRSPLYQKCTLASVEGRPLPSIAAEPTSTGSWEDMATFSRSLNDSKKVGWMDFSNDYESNVLTINEDRFNYSIWMCVIIVWLRNSL